MTPLIATAFIVGSMLIGGLTTVMVIRGRKIKTLELNVRDLTVKLEMERLGK